MNSTIRYERIKRRNASRNPKIIARNRRREHRLKKFSRAIRNELRDGLPEKKRKYWMRAGWKAFSIPNGRGNRTKFDRVKRESANDQIAEHIRSVGNNWTKEERGELRVWGTEFFYGKRTN